MFCERLDPNETEHVGLSLAPGLVNVIVDVLEQNKAAIMDTQPQSFRPLRGVIARSWQAGVRKESDRQGLQAQLTYLEDPYRAAISPIIPYTLMHARPRFGAIYVCLTCERMSSSHFTMM